MKDMLRTVTRTFRSKPVDKKTVSVSNRLQLLAFSWVSFIGLRGMVLETALDVWRGY